MGRLGMTDEAYEKLKTELRETAEMSCISYQLGKITREEAKKDILPYIDLMNKVSEEIAKKYSMRPKYITFNQFVR